jgi:hypothetical protein
MSRVRQVAREEMGLEQLHLAARAGLGLEEFYGRLGWREIGRSPGALRLGPGDDRDEVLMLLAPLRSEHRSRTALPSAPPASQEPKHDDQARGYLLSDHRRLRAVPQMASDRGFAESG